MLITILFARTADLGNLFGRQQLEISLDFVRRENARRRPSVAELLGINLRCFGVGFEAESVLDILQLFMVDLMVLAWTLASLTGFSEREKVSGLLREDGKFNR